MATSTSEDVFSTPQKSSLFNNAQRFPSLSSSQTTDTRARSPSIASTPDLTDASSISGSDSTNSAASIALGPKRAQTPSPRKLSTAPKPQTPQKIRAPLTIDAKPRKKASPAKTTRIQLGTPVKSLSRSATPSRPRTISSPGPKPSSRIFPTTPTQWDKDPEESLVDWRTVEDADGSFEMEEEKDARIVDDVLLGSGGAGSKDKVLVNVRIKPPSQGEFSAWISERPGAVKLEAAYAKVGTANTEHYYDNVLTGSANKPIYNAAAKSHVRAAMEGYNAVIFAYGQTASGKTFTLSGSESEPGIIPRAMRDVFTYIRNTPSREFLLRASYLEIYKEQIHDLLSSSTGSGGSLVLQDNGVVPGLREEVVMSVKGLKEVLERGEANRRTASTDWNARSSRSHSVFRLIIESREVASLEDFNVPPSPLPGGVPCTPGGSRLQARGGRSVRTSTLSLIDLAGSERATSDKARTSEGRYINQSLLTLGTVIGTLAENAGKKKQDFVPFRNSKLTKLLQPSLSGNARISVICTLNPSPASISESLSTLQFASRVKKVH
ncbi:Kinesin-like protein kip2, partial [Tulasnella sp. 403]